jgi:outer membrane receptor protein involved in Fe transport
MRCRPVLPLSLLLLMPLARAHAQQTNVQPGAPNAGPNTGPNAGPNAGPDAQPAVRLAPVDVVGSTPLLGSGIDRDKVPAATSVLTGDDLRRDGNPDTLRALEENVPGVTLNSASGNPYQPDLIYHGFTASPLQGNSQGLAVYVNGVRFNQAFGDTVNWDLIPDIAIDSLNVVGSNPAFGLNALGGALSVQLRNGFTYHGGEASLLGGSFGKIEGQFQYGAQSGNTAAYIAGTALHSDGWRNLQSSDIYNIYGDIGWRGDKGEVHLNIIAADNTLNGPGTSPVELLAADPSAQFTAPNLIANRYALVSLSGNYDVSDTTSLQALAYYSSFQQRVINGNSPDFGPCGDGSGGLCDDNGNPATDRAGNQIPDFLNGGPYSQLDQQTTNTNGYGTSLQVTNSDRIYGHGNQFVAGVSYDGANTLFSGSSAIGGLTPLDRVFVGPGVTVDQADGSIAPVRVAIDSNYYGVFLTDTFDVTSRLSVTASGRFNVATIDLSDQNGGAVSGNHSYNRFNPSAGATYRLAPWLTAYASYSEANRAPTPAELSCASAASPCSLANFFVGDPDLKQVVAHTVEAGLRGTFHPSDDLAVTWKAGYYHTDLDDDIAFVNSAISGRAFFQNVGGTRRQGVDAGLSAKTDRWLAYVNYSYTDATFRTGFIEQGGSNPAQAADGTLAVRPGDQLPGIPAHVVKLGISYKVTDHWTVGATGVAQSGQYLFGDEANLTPKLPGFFVGNFNTSYRITPNVEVFGIIENVTDTKYYYTYGTFSPTSSVPIAQVPGASNPRSYSPGAPIGGYAGVRVTF